eukprot:6184125-Pleurochrysis_carterae.AAC.1
MSTVSATFKGNKLGVFKATASSEACFHTSQVACVSTRTAACLSRFDPPLDLPRVFLTMPVCVSRL